MPSARRSRSRRYPLRPGCTSDGMVRPSRSMSSTSDGAGLGSRSAVTGGSGRRVDGPGVPYRKPSHGGPHAAARTPLPVRPPLAARRTASLPGTIRLFVRMKGDGVPSGGQRGGMPLTVLAPACAVAWIPGDYGPAAEFGSMRNGRRFGETGGPPGACARCRICIRGVGPRPLTGSRPPPAILPTT